MLASTNNNSAFFVHGSVAGLAPVRKIFHIERLYNAVETEQIRENSWIFIEYACFVQKNSHRVTPQGRRFQQTLHYNLRFWQFKEMLLNNCLIRYKPLFHAFKLF